MSGRLTFSPPQLAMAGGAAAVCALAFAAGLVSIATPAGFKSRLAAADAQIDTAARKLRAAHDDPVFPVDLICTMSPNQAAARLRGQLQGLATTSGLQVGEVSLRTEAAGANGFSPVRFHLEATGPYEAAVGALSAMSDLRPVVFVDTADMISKTSAVTLVVSGSLLCSAPN